MNDSSRYSCLTYRTQSPADHADPKGRPSEKGEKEPAGMNDTRGVSGPAEALDTVVLRAQRTNSLTSHNHSNTVSLACYPINFEYCSIANEHVL